MSRERYEDRFDDRLGVLRHAREMNRERARAEAKRDRRATKRRRDAELRRVERGAAVAVGSSVGGARGTDDVAVVRALDLARAGVRARMSRMGRW